MCSAYLQNYILFFFNSSPSLQITIFWMSILIEDTKIWNYCSICWQKQVVCPNHFVFWHYLTKNFNPYGSPKISDLKSTKQFYPIARSNLVPLLWDGTTLLLDIFWPITTQHWHLNTLLVRFTTSNFCNIWPRYDRFFLDFFSMHKIELATNISTYNMINWSLSFVMDIRFYLEGIYNY